MSLRGMFFSVSFSFSLSLSLSLSLSRFLGSLSLSLSLSLSILSLHFSLERPFAQDHAKSSQRCDCGTTRAKISGRASSLITETPDGSLVFRNAEDTYEIRNCRRLTQHDNFLRAPFSARNISELTSVRTDATDARCNLIVCIRSDVFRCTVIR